MDDELPVIIFIIINSNIKNIISEVYMLEDYMNIDQTVESEKRLVINLKVKILQY